MRQKAKVATVILFVLVLVIAAVWSMTRSAPVTVMIPNGPTLTLVDTTFNEPRHAAPKSNPVARVLQKLFLRVPESYRPRFLQRQFKMGFLHAVDDTAVFWFTENPSKTNGALRTWCPVQGRIWELDFRFPNTPGIVGIVCHHCPTNEPTLTISFYRANEGVVLRSDMIESNLLAQISVKNPAYQK